MREKKIKSKDKVIIVHYIGVKNMHDYDVPAFINEIATHMEKMHDDSILQFFVPLRSTSDIRVECINPVLVDSDKYAEATKKLKELEFQLKQSIQDCCDKQNDK